MRTPKEEAIELLEELLPYSDYNECDVFTQRENQFKNAKECALICVNKILKARTVGNTKVILDKEYWVEVKQEILKL